MWNDFFRIAGLKFSAGVIAEMLFFSLQAIAVNRSLPDPAVTISAVTAGLLE